MGILALVGCLQREAVLPFLRGASCPRRLSEPWILLEWRPILIRASNQSTGLVSNSPSRVAKGTGLPVIQVPNLGLSWNSLLDRSTRVLHPALPLQPLLAWMAPPLLPGLITVPRPRTAKRDNITPVLGTTNWLPPVPLACSSSAHTLWDLKDFAHAFHTCPEPAFLGSCPPDCSLSSIGSVPFSSA